MTYSDERIYLDDASNEIVMVRGPYDSFDEKERMKAIEVRYKPGCPPEFIETDWGVYELHNERITALEALLKDVWAAYGEKAESSFHPAWEVDGELAERMRELGIEGDYER